MLLLAYCSSNSFHGGFYGDQSEVLDRKWGGSGAGGGKTALLLAVDHFGSIQRAAEGFGMSYRHAWGVIKKIEQRAGFRILDKRIGGRDGGAQLTPKGKAFVVTTDGLFKDLQTIVERDSGKSCAIIL